MNIVYYVCVLVVGAALAHAKCAADVEKPTCIDITQPDTAFHTHDHEHAANQDHTHPHTHDHSDGHTHTHSSSRPTDGGNDQDVGWPNNPHLPTEEIERETVDCRKCYAEAFAVWITDPTAFLPACVAGSPLFVKQQYDAHKNESFCVDEHSGREFDGSRTTGTAVDCSRYPVDKSEEEPCFKKRANPTEPDFIPECQEDGFYNFYQCVVSPGRLPFCWCTTKSGQPVPNTFHQETNGTQAYCQAFRDFTFDCRGKEGTFHPYPTDCTRYIQCAPSGTFSCSCGLDTAWDRTSGTCNHASEVACENLTQNHAGNHPENHPADDHDDDDHDDHDDHDDP